MARHNTALAERIDPETPNLRMEIRRLVEEGRIDEARQLVRAEFDKGKQASDLGGFPELLALPKAVARPQSGRGDFAQNMAWLREHRDEHRGEWVALRDGALIDCDSDLGALRERLRAGPYLREVLCVKVDD